MFYQENQFDHSLTIYFVDTDGCPSDCWVLDAASDCILKPLNADGSHDCYTLTCHYDNIQLSFLPKLFSPLTSTTTKAVADANFGAINKPQLSGMQFQQTCPLGTACGMQIEQEGKLKQNLSCSPMKSINKVLRR